MIDTLYKVVTCAYHSIAVCGTYDLHYQIGTVVKARLGSLGIMTFDTLPNAIKLVDLFTNCPGAEHPIRLLQVEAQRRHRLSIYPKMAPWVYLDCLHTWYSAPKDERQYAQPLSGTVCYTQVKVVRELHKNWRTGQWQ